jgi:hypothetical protein
MILTGRGCREDILNTRPTAGTHTDTRNLSSILMTTTELFFLGQEFYSLGTFDKYPVIFLLVTTGKG